MKYLCAVVVLNFLLLVDCVNNNKREDVWEQDLSNSFNIDASTEGLQKVQLKCGSDSMQIELITKEDFTGVMYTRGSFYKQKAPCFMEGRGQRSLTMKFPLGQCQTLQDGELYSNVIVVQHDPELVTTGDAAFQVECDFRKPRSITVGADFQARDSRPAYASRITLTSPDPSAVSTHKRSKRDTAESDTHEVTFIPQNSTEGTVEDVTKDEHRNHLKIQQTRNS